MKELHLALIGGPQYDGLLELLPAFEKQTLGLPSPDFRIVAFTCLLLS